MDEFDDEQDLYLSFSIHDDKSAKRLFPILKLFSKIGTHHDTGGEFNFELTLNYRWEYSEVSDKEVFHINEFKPLEVYLRRSNVEVQYRHYGLIRAYAETIEKVRIEHVGEHNCEA